MEELDPTFIEFLKVCDQFDYNGSFFEKDIFLLENLNPESGRALGYDISFRDTHACLKKRADGKICCVSFHNYGIASLVGSCIFELCVRKIRGCDKYLVPYMDYLASPYNKGSATFIGARQFVNLFKEKKAVPLFKGTSTFLPPNNPYSWDHRKDIILSQLSQSNKTLRESNKKLLNKSVEHERTKSRNKELKETIIAQSKRFTLLGKEVVAKNSMED